MATTKIENWPDETARQMTLLLEGLREILQEHESDSDRGQLTGITADAAFDMGYRSAIRDIEEMTGIKTTLKEF